MRIVRALAPLSGGPFFLCFDSAASKHRWPMRAALGGQVIALAEGWLSAISRALYATGSRVPLLAVCTFGAYNQCMGFEWDERKAETNFQDHKVRFAESLSVFEDDHAITVTDEESDPHEQRFVALGMGTKGRVLVVVYCYRDQNIRII